MKICLATILAAAILPSLASAQDNPARDFDLKYGFGVVGTSGVYVGQKDELFPFPLIVLSQGQWTLSIPKGIQFRALETATTHLTFSLVYDPAPDLPKTALFNGLDRADGAAFEVEALHDFTAFDIATTIKRDVSQNHDGISGEVSVGRSVLVGNTFLEGRIGTHYVDGNYGNYLYGVANSEANSLRTAYDLKANWSPFVEISAVVPLNEATSLIAGFRHEQLSKEISDSPLVGTDESTTFGISLIRQF